MIGAGQLLHLPCLETARIALLSLRAAELDDHFDPYDP